MKHTPLARAVLAFVPLAVPGILAAQTGAGPSRPALVVLIAVDQFRGDYLDRFGGQLTGGLARFRNKSAFFPNAWQDHSNTETAPGHASMLSGREPAHTEIISNNRGVPDPNAPLIGGIAGPGASPRRFNGTTLVDWLIACDSGIRVLSVSRKDRGAILPIGRVKGNVYWFSDGQFTTSSYYSDTLPAWVKEFDANIHLDRLAGTKWDLLLPASAYPEPDSEPVEHSGTDFIFPHVLPSADQLRANLQQYPAMDSVTLAFALDGIRATRIGTRALSASNAMPDVLSISLSTTDAVGHAYGPDSREIHDQVLRVDRWLGTFLDSLQRQVPANRMVLVLTADHGVSSFPELSILKTGHGGRVWLGDVASTFEQALESRYHADFALEFDNGLFYADLDAMRVRGINIDSLANAIVAVAVKRPGIRSAFTAKTIAKSADSGAVRWRRTIPVSQGWIVAAVARPDFIWSPGKSTAEHGTPNAKELSIPIAFMGRGHRARAVHATRALGGHRADAREATRRDTARTARWSAVERGDRVASKGRAKQIAPATTCRGRYDSAWICPQGTGAARRVCSIHAPLSSRATMNTVPFRPKPTICRPAGTCTRSTSSPLEFTTS